MMPDLELRPSHVQIMVCKACGHIQLTNELVLKKLEAMSKNHEIARDACAYASLTWFLSNCRSGNNVRDFGKLLAAFRKSLNSSDNPRELRPCLKAVSLIGHYDASLQDNCKQVLSAFINGKSAFCRDWAFYRLVGSLLDWDDDVGGLVAAGIGHVTIRLSQTRQPLPLVFKGLCKIAHKRPEYRQQILELLRSVIGPPGPYAPPPCVFSCVLDLDVPRTESSRVTPAEKDVWDGHDVANEIGDDAAVIFDWKQTRGRVGVLYQFDLATPDVGNMPPGDWVQTPYGKNCSIYEDVVARFMMAISHPQNCTLTIPSLLARLADRTKIGRVPYTWESIPEMLGLFAVLNYVQLLYSLLLTEKPIDVRHLQGLIFDLNDCYQNAKQKVQQQSGAPKREPTSPAATFRPQRRPK
jgi:hypothetical protein